MEIEASNADGTREEPEDWDPPEEIDTSWTVWVLLESIGWEHLMVQGGILDQPEGLMQDVSIISWMSGIVESWLKQRQ